MPSPNDFEDNQRRNVAQRREAIKAWAAFVRTHDDEEWSKIQNTIIDAQLETANELAARGDIDPVEFFERRDDIRR